MLTEIKYALSVNPQRTSSRVRLTQGVGPVSTGRINGTMTLMKGQQMCVNTTAILEVNAYKVNTKLYKQFIKSTSSMYIHLVMHYNL